MHMTPVEALLVLAPRRSCAAIQDQHTGGAIALFIGGAVDLTGGLWLAATILRHGSPARRRTA